jgi:hypothetical protein
MTTVMPSPAQLRSQSLAEGAAGIALRHLEQTANQPEATASAHLWVAAAAHGPQACGLDAGLYYGLPAFAFALRVAEEAAPGRYRRTLQEVDRRLHDLVRHRLEHAYARIRRGQHTTLPEFDLIYGLTGIGAHLLRHSPDDDALLQILSYLVRLSEPIRIDGSTQVGWWTEQDPHLSVSPGFPGGHANIGVAHGISGPLALLALASIPGVRVDGHHDAIERICAWLDTWRQDSPGGAWWPQWITAADRDVGHVKQDRPGRPSWCYGTPGVARAQQLAAIAIGDVRRQHMAEHAIAGCLADPNQVGAITDPGLCHGLAGLVQTAWRAAADATAPGIAAALPRLIDALTDAPPAPDPGLLLGDAGLALARLTVNRGAVHTGWDTCLLIA